MVTGRLKQSPFFWGGGGGFNDDVWGHKLHTGNVFFEVISTEVLVGKQATF